MKAAILNRVLTLRPRQLNLEGRFPGARTDAADRLHAVVGAFGAGYNAGLVSPDGPLDLSAINPDLRGFGYEGAAMSRTLLDLMLLSRGERLRGLAAGAGSGYIHLIHVGAGWAFARLHVRPWTAVHFAHPGLRWLAWDGWGFHNSYFKSERVFGPRAARPAGSGTRPITDQGSGRALWFYAGAEPGRAAEVISAFHPGRRADLWAGIGVAAAYTGALEPDRTAEVLEAGADYQAHIAQGAAFAAKACQLADWMPARSAAVIEGLTGVSPHHAAAWTDTAFAEVAGRPDSSACYQAWRAAIRQRWSLSKRGVTL